MKCWNEIINYIAKYKYSVNKKMRLQTTIFIIVFFTIFTHLYSEETNEYQRISQRNAFDLTTEIPKPILPPVAEILRPSVFMTGMTRFNGVRKIHLVLRKAGEPDKFVSLAANEKQYNVELKKIYKNSALISNDGASQLLSFEKNSLPTIITKAAAKLSKSSEKDKRESSGKRSSDSSKRASTTAPRPSQPQVVTVPSRRPKVDPRIIEKGLEYLSRMEDGEKKEFLLKRIESLQSGQNHIKSDIQQNERRRQYDEWRKRNK